MQELIRRSSREASCLSTDKLLHGPYPDNAFPF